MYQIKTYPIPSGPVPVGGTLAAESFGFTIRGVVISNYSAYWLSVQGADDPYVPPYWINVKRTIRLNTGFLNIYYNTPFYNSASQPIVAASPSGFAPAQGVAVPDNGTVVAVVTDTDTGNDPGIAIPGDGTTTVTGTVDVNVVKIGGGVVDYSSAFGVIGAGYQVVMKQSAVSVGNAPTKLPAVPISGAGLRVVFNNDTAKTLYLGNSAVTTADGQPVLPQRHFAIPLLGTIDAYGIVTAGSIDVRVLEFS